MKRTLSFITTIVIALCPVSMFAQETTAERIKEKSSEALETTKKKANEAAKTVSEKSKEAWRKTKAYLSQDPQTYRDGANQRLEELAAKSGRSKPRARMRNSRPVRILTQDSKRWANITSSQKRN